MHVFDVVTHHGHEHPLCVMVAPASLVAVCLPACSHTLPVLPRLTHMCVCVVLPTCLVWLLLLHVVMCVGGVLCVLLLCLVAGNKLGKEGAQALAPALAKLTQLQTLDLGGECVM